mgnify:FL=1
MNIFLDFVDKYLETLLTNISWDLLKHDPNCLENDIGGIIARN